MAAPTVTQQAADTVHGVRSYFRFTPAVGVVVEAIATLFDYEGQNETIKNMAPGADGVLRPNRESQKSSEESFSVELVEIKKGHTVLGGLNKMRKGAVEIWIFDPDDAAGKAKIRTNNFTCSVKRDGNVSFGAEDFAKMKLKFTNLSGADVTTTFDGDA